MDAVVARRPALTIPTEGWKHWVAVENQLAQNGVVAQALAAPVRPGVSLLVIKPLEVAPVAVLVKEGGGGRVLPRRVALRAWRVARRDEMRDLRRLFSGLPPRKKRRTKSPEVRNMSRPAPTVSAC